MAKLTWSVDDREVAAATRSTKLRGLSVSEMVEAYLDAVANGTRRADRDTGRDRYGLRGPAGRQAAAAVIAAAIPPVFGRLSRH